MINDEIQKILTELEVETDQFRELNKNIAESKERLNVAKQKAEDMVTTFQQLQKSYTKHTEAIIELVKESSLSTIATLESSAKKLEDAGVKVQLNSVAWLEDAKAVTGQNQDILETLKPLVFSLESSNISERLTGLSHKQETLSTSIEEAFRNLEISHLANKQVTEEGFAHLGEQQRSIEERSSNISERLTSFSHKQEILSTSIEEAFRNLEISHLANKQITEEGFAHLGEQQRSIEERFTAVSAQLSELHDKQNNLKGFFEGSFSHISERISVLVNRQEKGEELLSNGLSEVNSKLRSIRFITWVTCGLAMLLCGGMAFVTFFGLIP